MIPISEVTSIWQFSIAISQQPHVFDKFYHLHPYFWENFEKENYSTDHFSKHFAIDVTLTHISLKDLFKFWHLNKFVSIIHRFISNLAFSHPKTPKFCMFSVTKCSLVKKFESNTPVSIFLCECPPPRQTFLSYRPNSYFCTYFVEKNEPLWLTRMAMDTCSCVYMFMKNTWCVHSLVTCWMHGGRHSLKINTMDPMFFFSQKLSSSLSSPVPNSETLSPKQTHAHLFGRIWLKFKKLMFCIWKKH